MRKKYEKFKSVLDGIFWENKDWVWIIILLLAAICITFAVCVDLGKIEIGDCVDQICKADVRCILWKASETVCSIVVTYSTVLTAVVVFFYSMIDNKRLGVPYRRLILYTVGSHTIPVLFVVTILLTVFMSVARHIPLKYTVYVCAIFIFMMQVFAIIEILLSTSYKHCKRVICRIEKKKYILGSGINGSDTEWAYSFGHLERAMHSEEFISEKKELLKEFLWIPYKAEKSRKNITEIEKSEQVYQFYYVNILSAFRDFNGDIKHLERNQLYMSIREFVLELLEKNGRDMKTDKETQRIYHATLSGIINGLIASNVEGGMGFCSHIISKCIADSDACRRQFYLLVLFLEMLSMMNQQEMSENNKIGYLGGWKPMEMGDVELCAESWDMWTKMYDFSFAVKMQHFEYAIQTMSGYRNRSMVILEIILAMRKLKKAGRENDGKNCVNEDTASYE